MNERLQKQMNFILEIDKEKNIFRQTHLTNHGRNENDAEHAWHMAIMTYLLKEHANEKIDVAKTMMMCLIHDIVEIDAGDTYAYDTEGLKTQKAREDLAKERMALKNQSGSGRPSEISRGQILTSFLTTRGYPIKSHGVRCS